MADKIDDEFAFLDKPAGGIDLDAPPAGSVNLTNEYPADKRIMNPLTGALVDTDDIDSLILGCVDAKQQLADLRSFEDTLRRRLGEFTSGDAKTRRVKGKLYTAKLEMADEGWEQPILKEAWQAYPKFRDDYLKIGSIAVQKREFNKLASMSTDDPAFQTFKTMLQNAVRPATGAPTVSQEK